MAIESLQLKLASQHTAFQSSISQTTIQRASSGLSGPDGPASSRPPGPSARISAPVPAPASVPAASTEVSLSPEGAAISDSEEALKADPRYAIVKSLYEQITGLAFDDAGIDLHRADGAQLPAGRSSPPGQPSDSAQASDGAQAAPPRAPGRASDRSVTLTHQDIRTESEHTQFSAQGRVTTSDGRQIDFSFELDLQRSHSESSTATVRLGPPPKLSDPLVLNFATPSAQLTDTKYSFDLNADGTAENISFVTSGSGFLALDKNADGVINDGSELFGAGSGDGFADLAAYDADHNQVIDENDPIFSQLRIFNKDASGQDQVATLAEKGVQAIFLAHADTQFDLKDAQNQLQGRLRSTGVYLNESGSVGSVQQIDLKV
jgi:hypothetical protein